MDNPPQPGFAPFTDHLGIELVAWGKGEAEIRLDLKPHQQNGLGVAHGGVIMALLDVVMALAAKSSHPQASGMVTVDLSASFIRPARGELHAFGWCDHHSSTMAFCKAELRDVHGRVLARGMGTFKRMTALSRSKKTGSD